jgi:hypothetical protein
MCKGRAGERIGQIERVGIVGRDYGSEQSDECENSDKNERGLFTMIRWNGIMTNPPLCITEDQLAEGFGIIDEALTLADRAAA